jgi:hypothetical protein
MVITSSPDTLSVVSGIRVDGSEEAALTFCRLRRCDWQGEAPFQTGGNAETFGYGQGDPRVS